MLEADGRSDGDGGVGGVVVDEGGCCGVGWGCCWRRGGRG